MSNHLDILELRKIRLFDKMAALLHDGYQIIKTESKGFEEHITVRKPNGTEEIIKLEPFVKQTYEKPSQK